MANTISIGAQIEEAEREIRLREGVYPRQVSSGKMRQSVADMHLARMRAILRTLQWLQANEETIRAVVKDRTAEDSLDGEG